MGQSEENKTEIASSQLDAVIHEVRQVQDQIRGLEEKLHAVLAEWTRSRTDLTGSSDELHRRTAGELEQFINQKLQPLALVASANINDGTRRRKRIAQLINRLFLCYLAPSGVDLRRARRILQCRKGDDIWLSAGNAALRAKQILDTARNLGVEFVWDYGFDPEFPVNDDRQKVWSSCDPSGDIAFVVTPAYVADGECFLHQQVYTDSGSR
ncbi:hypothetical protein ACWCXH_25255 [Kitasatospora sp. NPDC001660]